ncbi:hypothetical protein BZG72_15245 [Salinivibrio sp. PR6]|uniref:glycosyltransferase n=1 Tax=Salinivibrio sp. PR6 TaxID=1909485 RepID=UPI000989271D|nr:glycosyltransferase [Salinivibrio sp. PR6]OOE78664.1 hypothetical protein BZG72_15245 [Salinivibrio sp. PR6]
MRVILDASNIKAGGGLQVALSFIYHINDLHMDMTDFYYMLSPQVMKQLPVEVDNSKIVVVQTDIKTAIPFSSSSRVIRKFIRHVGPDVVFTLFGPSFWTCNGRHSHVMGFANAWVVTPDTIAYKKLPYLNRLATRLKNFILRKFLYEKSRFYITETRDIKEKMLSLMNINESKVSVVPNALPYMYDDKFYSHDESLLGEYRLSSDRFNIVTIASNYPHKNLTIIADVAEILFDYGYKVNFYVTMPETEYDKCSERFKSFTINLGVVPVEACKQIYKSADLMFLPTLLECFSVSYLESMKCLTPICTTDFLFAREVCHNAAVYYEPSSAIDAALKIRTLLDDVEEYYILKSRCSEVIEQHITNEERSKLYLKELLKVQRDCF